MFPIVTMPMKRLFQLSLLLCSLPGAAWNVTTMPTNKRALIEEFTGIHCQNCPDGHRMAARIKALHPEEVFIVAIHAGAFAAPYPSQPDYRTDLGEFLNEHFVVTGYPSGAVSRVPGTEDAIILNRSAWSPSARNAIKGISPVNLWAESSYNADSRTLTVDVEGYVTGEIKDLRLNAWMLQNEVVGPQTGGQLGNEYHHRHMLRARINDGDLGEQIADAASGSYFKRSYSYTIPDAIREVVVDPANIELLIFATEGDGEVYTVVESRPEGAGCENTFAASSAVAPIPVAKNYALDYFEVMLMNHGGKPLTTATFDVKLNNVLTPVTWTGEIPGHESRLIHVPLGQSWDSALDSESNSGSWRLREVNGQEMDEFTNTFTFGALFSYPNELTFKIKTDLDAADNTYRIIDRQGNVVKEFGPYANDLVAEYVEKVTLEPDTIYGLEIVDKWGDGVRHPLGYVKIYDQNDELVATIREINDYGMRQFFRTYQSSALETISTANSEATYYDLTGRRVEPNRPGIYLRTADGKSEKVVVK